MNIRDELRRDIAEDKQREAAGLVRCDDRSCRAPKNPRTAEDYELAYIHWRTHHIDGGCSHGC